MIVHQLNFEEMRHQRVILPSDAVQIGDLIISAEDELSFDAGIGTISTSALIASAAETTCIRQLAAHLFLVTRKARLMNFYFPITHALDPAADTNFHRLITNIAQKPTFDLRLTGERRIDDTVHLPPDAGYLVAGHIAEIFFYRPDLLDQFLSQRRGFWLYTTPTAFTQDGGAAGGDYDPQRGAVQLLLSRLYEGFYAPTPGVAPFIHEFGHMLDHATGNRGLIPGMAGVIDLFRRGKALEIERYQRQPGSEPFPIGHPYVFQNDGEFIAGYLEMFFRNPHYFAEQNPDLFQAFAQCLGQDPRQYWQADFPFYIQQNRNYYLNDQRPRPHGLTLPQ
jgi:Glucose-regulated metallo-peptidase M90